MPPAPGSTPIPKGKIRAYHYTNRGEEALANILKEGLSTAYSRGATYGEPNVIWFSTTKPGDGKHYVEVFLDPEDLEGGIGGPHWAVERPDGWKLVETDEERQESIDKFNEPGTNFAVGVDKIPPEKIVTHSEPWMAKYHAFIERVEQERTNPSSPALEAFWADRLQEVVAGKMDDVGKGDPVYAKVIAAIKEEYGPAKPKELNYRARLDQFLLDVGPRGGCSHEDAGWRERCGDVTPGASWSNRQPKQASALSGKTPPDAPLKTYKAYHVTTRENAQSILANGFDLGKVKPRWQNDYAVSLSRGEKSARTYFSPRDPKTGRPQLLPEKYRRAGSQGAGPDGPERHDGGGSCAGCA